MSAQNRKRQSEFSQAKSSTSSQPRLLNTPNARPQSRTPPKASPAHGGSDAGDEDASFNFVDFAATHGVSAGSSPISFGGTSQVPSPGAVIKSERSGGATPSSMNADVLSESQFDMRENASELDPGSRSETPLFSEDAWYGTDIKLQNATRDSTNLGQALKTGSGGFMLVSEDPEEAKPAKSKESEHKSIVGDKETYGIRRIPRTDREICTTKLQEIVKRYTATYLRCETDHGLKYQSDCVEGSLTPQCENRKEKLRSKRYVEYLIEHMFDAEDPYSANFAKVLYDQLTEHQHPDYLYMTVDDVRKDFKKAFPHHGAFADDSSIDGSGMQFASYKDLQMYYSRKEQEDLDAAMAASLASGNGEGSSTLR